MRSNSCYLIKTACAFLTVSYLLGACKEESKAPAPESFNFTDFRNSYGLNLLGDASIFTGTDKKSMLRLTQYYSNQRGGCWYGRSKVLLKNGFETVFTFQITDDNGQTYPEPPVFGADGLAFVIQNIGQDSLGLHEGYGLGYEGLPNSLAVELDMYRNPSLGDLNDNHISIHTKGNSANTANETASLERNDGLLVNLKDKMPHTVKITYVPGTLSVLLDNQPVVTTSVNLEEKLKLSEGKAYIGFTAATGALSQNHNILSWSFTPKNTD